jgi:hypothetical protein
LEKRSAWKEMGNKQEDDEVMVDSHRGYEDDKDEHGR